MDHRNFKRPSGPTLPTTLMRVTGLILRPSLGAACLLMHALPSEFGAPLMNRGFGEAFTRRYLDERLFSGDSAAAVP
jgi:hypothetical protein